MKKDCRNCKYAERLFKKTPCTTIIFVECSAKFWSASWETKTFPAWTINSDTNCSQWEKREMEPLSLHPKQKVLHNS